MKFSFNIFVRWKESDSLNLATILAISWWIIFSIGIALLFLDGIVFYLYGLGYASVPPLVQESGAIRRVQRESIERAASTIETAKSQFNDSSTISTDLPNPFK